MYLCDIQQVHHLFHGCVVLPAHMEVVLQGRQQTEVLGSQCALPAVHGVGVRWSPEAADVSSVRCTHSKMDKSN